jgi:hypothetical protein
MVYAFAPIFSRVTAATQVRAAVARASWAPTLSAIAICLLACATRPAIAADCQIFAGTEICTGDVILFRGGLASILGEPHRYGHAAMFLGFGQTLHDPTFFDWTTNDKAFLGSDEFVYRYRSADPDRLFDIYRPNSKVDKNKLWQQARYLASRNGYGPQLIPNHEVCSTSIHLCLLRSSDVRVSASSPAIESIWRMLGNVSPNDFANPDTLGQYFRKINSDSLRMPPTTSMGAILKQAERSQRELASNADDDDMQTDSSDENVAEDELHKLAREGRWRALQHFADSVCNYERFRNITTGSGLNGISARETADALVQQARAQILSAQVLISKDEIFIGLAEHDVSRCGRDIIQSIADAPTPLDTAWYLSQVDYELAGGPSGEAARNIVANISRAIRSGSQVAASVAAFPFSMIKAVMTSISQCVGCTSEGGGSSNGRDSADSRDSQRHAPTDWSSLRQARGIASGGKGF